MLRYCRLAPFRKFSTSFRPLALRPFILADVGEGIKECEVIQWMVQPGARLDEFDLVCELQSDKATVEITSRYSGVVKKLYYEPGEMAQVGSPLIDIEVADNDESSRSPAAPSTKPAQPLEQATEKTVETLGAKTPSQSTPSKSDAARAQNRALATPAVRRLSREHSIEISQLQGTGRDGRVLKEDVLAAIKARSTGQQPSSSSSPSQQPNSRVQTATTGAGESTIVPLRGMAKQMFAQMSASVSIPHFLFTEEIEMSNLVKLRTQLNQRLPVKITYMPFMIKALSMAITQYPMVNSRVVTSPDGEPSIEMRSAHNISVAMDTPQGLAVPVIKNVELKSIAQIAGELRELQAAGTAGKLKPDQLQGGTITLSNIGTVGGNYVSPVIVPSQVAIGGVGAIRKLPRFDEQNNVVAKHIMYTSWSGDHRVLDGVTLAKMVVQWKHYLEHPEEMVLDLS